MAKIYSLDLHNLNLKVNANTRGLVHKRIDSFLLPHLTKPGTQCEIIVGRGHNSKTSTFIKGMPVLRYYTMEYLAIIGIESQYKYLFGKFSFVI
jgi:hypothetical protein